VGCERVTVERYFSSTKWCSPRTLR